MTAHPDTVSRWNRSYGGQMTRQPDGQWVEYVAHAATVEALRREVFTACEKLGRVRALTEDWETRSRGALPVDAMLVNKHIRELRAALKDTTP